MSGDTKKNIDTSDYSLPPRRNTALHSQIHKSNFGRCLLLCIYTG